MERGEVRVFESTEELSKSLAEYVVEISDAFIRERGVFSIAFTGGNLPHLLWELTKPSPYLNTVEWPKWQVFWAVENVVPKTHPDNIYKQTKEALLSKLRIPSANIFSVGHAATAEEAAEMYEYKIRQQVRNRTVDVSPSSDCPRFDLIVLMLEPDGQVAGLLPEHGILQEESMWVAPVGNERVTFTLPVINSAANVAVIANGPDVSWAFATGLGPQMRFGAHPAQLVRPNEGRLVWFADADAASDLGGGGGGGGGAASDS